MNVACRRIGTLVTRIQNAYLDQPDLALTLEQAGTRFRVDAETARALFGLFRESGVLVQTGGVYRLQRRSRPARPSGPRLQTAA
jgi:hypothetical protein